MGQIIALVSAFSYALSYCFLRKGQSKATPPDFGLLPILILSALTLDCVFGLQLAIQPRRFGFAAMEWSPLVWAGMSGIVATLFGRLFLYRAIDQLGATRGVILKGLSPLVTLICAVAFLDHDVLQSDLLGLVGVLAAMGLLFLERALYPVRGAAWIIFQNGIAIGILAACLQGIGHAFRELGIDDGVAPSVASATDITAACLGYIVILGCTGKLRSLWSWYRNNGTFWLIAAGLSSSVGVFCFFLATSQIPVSTVSILVATEPIFVTLLSALFFWKLERPTLWTGAAALVITGSVIALAS